MALRGSGRRSGAPPEHRYRSIHRMTNSACTIRIAAMTLALAVCAAALLSCARVEDGPREPVPQAAPPAKRGLDFSGHKRVGQASIYASRFAGRTMADGTPMDPNGDNAASKTLPLGTIAKVTNLETGSSAVVTIRDRGPHVKGRIVDLSPSTARKIGLTLEAGLAMVEVEPIVLPRR